MIQKKKYLNFIYIYKKATNLTFTCHFFCCFPLKKLFSKMSDNRNVVTQMRKALEKEPLKIVVGKCLDFYAPVAKKLLAECLFGRHAPQNAHNQQQILVLTHSGSVIGCIKGELEDTLLEKLKSGISWKIEKPLEFFNLWGLRDDGKCYLLPYNVPIAELPDEVILVAVESKHESKQHMLTTMKQKGWRLFFASDELRADREVVLAAVTQYGFALGFASKTLQADREVVLAAVTQCGDVLQLAPDDLNADREIVLAAMTQCGDALKFASTELRADPEIRAAAGFS